MRHHQSSGALVSGSAVPALASVLAIELPFDPNITTIGGFLLTWHGLFTAVGILVGVRLSLWISREIGFDVDDAYTLALIGIPSGIIGARALFVIEHWDYYGQNVADIMALTEGGIPCTVGELKERFDAFVADLTKGKDATRVRVVVER